MAEIADINSTRLLTLHPEWGEKDSFSPDMSPTKLCPSSASATPNEGWVSVCVITRVNESPPVPDTWLPRPRPGHDAEADGHPDQHHHPRRDVDALVAPLRQHRVPPELALAVQVVHVQAGPQAPCPAPGRTGGVPDTLHRGGPTPRPSRHTNQRPLNTVRSREGRGMGMAEECLPFPRVAGGLAKNRCRSRC